MTIEVDGALDNVLAARVRALVNVQAVTLLAPVSERRCPFLTELHFDSLAALAAEAEAQKAPISAVVLAAQARSTERSRQALYEQMRQNLEVMRESVRQGLAPGVKSASGLSGGDAHRMAAAFAGGGAGLCGPALCGALARPLPWPEWNAAMGRIGGGAHGGSCGILPARLCWSAEEALGLAEEPCVMALFPAAGVGLVIAHNACLGAQAAARPKCGSAAAMASAALVELCGGTPAMALSAVALTLKACWALCATRWPALWRYPASSATPQPRPWLSPAPKWLAGVESAIPADEVVAAMKRVGDSMPAALKETAEGGLAATPPAQALFEQVFGPYGAGRGSRRLRACCALPVARAHGSAAKLSWKRPPRYFQLGWQSSASSIGGFFFVHS